MSATKARHTSAHRCPICNGADGDPRGRGERCHGYTEDQWAHCSRAELAGKLALHEGSGTFAHRLSGPCNCGVAHGTASGSYRQRDGVRYAKIIATYDYRAVNGCSAYEVLRRADKTFTQRRRPRPADDATTISKDGWVYNLQGVQRVPYRLDALAAAPADAIAYVPEGEKDVDTLRSQGLVATCNPGGAGKWRRDYSQYLRGRSVVILADNDDVGIEHAQQVAGMLHGTAARIKILLLPDLPTHGDVSDWLGAGHTREELEALAAGAPDWTAAGHGPRVAGDGAAADAYQTGDDSRPYLYINDALIMINGSLALLDQAITNAAVPHLWWREGELTRVAGQPGSRSARRIGPVDLGVMVAQLARIMRAGEGKPAPARLARFDLEQILSHAQQRPDKIRAPELLQVVHVPYIDETGRVVASNGYDPATRLYLDAPDALAALDVPEYPDAASVAAARDALDRAVVREFQWADEASRAHAWAILLTPGLLSLLGPHANIPLFLVTKPAPGSGATYFTQIVGALYSGVPAEPQRVPPMDDTDEWAKSVIALLRKGPPLAVLDNVTEPIGNAVLDALLTSRHYSGRLLGTNETPTYPNNTLWVATGNNIRPRSDTSRRVVLARIDTGLERPEDRTFDRDPLVDTIRDRRTLLAAALTLIRAWHVAGRPGGDTRTYASYDEWARAIGGILRLSGIAGFLTNRDSVRAATDEEGGAWAAVLRAVQEFRPGIGSKTSQLLQETKDVHGQIKGYQFATPELGQAAPVQLRECIGQRRLLTQLGKALGEQVDRPHGGRVLRRVSTHGGSPTYRVEDLPPACADLGDGLAANGDGLKPTVTTAHQRELPPLVTSGDAGDGFSTTEPYRAIVDGGCTDSFYRGRQRETPSPPSPTVARPERTYGDGLPGGATKPSPDRHHAPPPAQPGHEGRSERMVI